MKQQNYQKGKRGENEAWEFLKSKGYDLITKNYDCNLGEIDLIVRQVDTLVFVEVKMKTGDKFGLPEDMINCGKLSQIRRVAEAYLYFNPEMRKRYLKYRFDAVCIVENDTGEVLRINHYENIYA